MAILGQIRSRPWLLMGMIALALLAFLVNPESLDKVFGKNPDVLGKVNAEKSTRLSPCLCNKMAPNGGAIFLGIHTNLSSHATVKA